MEAYEELWQKFKRERRLEYGGHTDPQWRDGHDLSASFVVPVRDGGVRRGLEPLREVLRRFPYVSLHPDRFLHITLLLPGFPVRKPEAEEEISYRRMEDLASEARKVLAGFEPFAVELRNLNVFPGAVFVEVHDGGEELLELREALRERCGLDEPPGPPHLTVAYIKAPDDSLAPRTFVEAVERNRDRPVGELRVERVELTLLNLREEYAEPETFAALPLGDRAAG